MLLTEVEVLERSLFKIGEGDFESTLEKGVRAKTAYAMRQAIGQRKPEEALAKLKEKINSLTYLNLTVAFEPTLEAVNRFYIWAKQNAGEGVAIDLTVDKSILGGAIVEYKGRVSKTILKEKLDDYFLNNHVNV